jgi:beta-glucosidase
MRSSRLSFLLALAVCTYVSAQAPDSQRASANENLPLYLNPEVPVDQRVNDLVSRMTLEEKISQMQNNAPAIPHLGIPAYGWANEALHGVALAGHATVFRKQLGWLQPGIWI